MSCPQVEQSQTDGAKLNKILKRKLKCHKKSRLCKKIHKPASFKKHEIYFCFSIQFLALTKASIQGVTSSVFFLSSG